MIIYSYPVKVILVDDNIEFLEVLSLNLKNKNFFVEAFSDVCLVRTLLEKYPSKLYSEFDVKDGDFLGEKAISVNIEEVRNVYSNKNQNKEFVVLVIDNNMPKKNGIDFLKTINESNVYKILLTGETEESTVIEAFNAGIIDGYISKADTALYEKLPQQITKGINKYFKNRSDLLVKSIIHDSTRITALSSNVYKNFVYNIIQQYNIIEYYLLDTQGSYIMFGSEGRVYTLLILGEDSAKAHLDIAIEEGCSKELLESAKLNQGKIYSNYKTKDSIEFLLLDKKIKSLEGFVYKMFDGDILDFTV